ncbi:MAG: alpha/beta fold hydrolase [Nitrosopumilales archaeon]|nr:alpha/beta fold hydrolase [Nitrosopumilales archaeon]
MFVLLCSYYQYFGGRCKKRTVFIVSTLFINLDGTSRARMLNMHFQYLKVANVRVRYLEYYSKFISKFIRRLRIDSRSLCIVGNSLGGHIAAEFAINYPLAVSKLVLVSPAGALPVSFKGTPELRNYLNIVKAKTVQQVRRDLLGIDKNVKSIEYNYAKMFFQRLKLPRAKEAFMSAFSGSAHAPRLTGRLHKIKAKTLLIWGKDDQMIPVNFLHPFIKMKNCRVILLENCGHSVHMNSSTLFNKFVIDFLKE